MANVSDFMALIAKYNVPEGNQSRSGYTTLWATPAEDVSKMGVRINLPIVITAASDDYAYLLEDQKEETFSVMIYQRYLDNNELFVPCNHPDPMRDEDLVGANSDDFSTLEKLLMGETIRFYDCFKRNYVDVALRG